MLREQKGVISGEILSRRLDTSRVSVWRHIKKLQELGYSIESTPKGYELTGGPDTPYPWEFEDYPERVHYFASVGSTMDIARDLARKNAPHLSVVVAGSQSRGRGRLKPI